MWDGLFEAPQPPPNCALSELGWGLLPAGGTWRPPVARRCHKWHQLQSVRNLFAAGAHCPHTTRPACWPHYAPEAAAKPAHHQRQHHLCTGPEGLLSHTGVAELLPAAGLTQLILFKKAVIYLFFCYRGPYSCVFFLKLYILIEFKRVQYKRRT